MCGAHGVTSKRCWYPGRDHIYTRCMSLASRRWRNMIETYVLETWRDGTKHTCFGHMLPLISTNDFKVLKISGCLYIIHDAFWEMKKSVYQLDEPENTRHTQWNMFNDTGMLSRLHNTVMLVLLLVKSTVVHISYQLQDMSPFCQRHTAAATVYSMLYKTL